jgi:imidazolonepropionase
MTSFTLTGIGCLVTGDPETGDGPLGTIRGAALVVDNGGVLYAGPAERAPQGTDTVVDLDGRCVLPGFVDSHTHLVFAGERAGEFAARMAGQPYRPGGILQTVTATRAASPEQLEAHARALVQQALRSGTTTLEIKTGYGLAPEPESRHLEVAARLTSEVTFLGAHLVPPEYEADRSGYVRLLCEEMIPAASSTARWCDVFCESGAFDEDESRSVLDAGRRAGLGLRVHANQLGPGPGVALACEMGAASADHCTHLSDTDVDLLASSSTVATLLPISDFCTRQPYPDARRLVDAGATVAIASNCNPGSSYSTSMPLALALAVRECGLSLDEALLAATRGGAAALRRSDGGRLSAGARADAIVLDAPDPYHLIYRLGTPLVSSVLQRGSWALGSWPRT